MGDEEERGLVPTERGLVPTLHECQHDLAEWERFVEHQIELARSDVEALEEHLEQMEDRLLWRGAIAGAISILAGTSGAILGLANPILGVVFAVIAGGASGEATARAIFFRRNRRAIRKALKSARTSEQEWQRELQGLGKARERIEREILVQQLGAGSAGQIASGDQKQLPGAGATPGKPKGNK